MDVREFEALFHLDYAVFLLVICGYKTAEEDADEGKDLFIIIDKLTATRPLKSQRARR